MPISAVMTINISNRFHLCVKYYHLSARSFMIISMLKMIVNELLRKLKTL
jgi:hypothetical protein